jgi:carbon storage regulator
MLVLSRKLGERIVVPDCDLVVTVIAAKGNVVRLGISAPEDLDVYREEVWQRVCQEESPAQVIPLGQRSKEPREREDRVRKSR